MAKFLYTDKIFYKGGNHCGSMAVNVDEIKRFYIQKRDDDSEKCDVYAELKSGETVTVRSIFLSEADAYLYICRVVNWINEGGWH